MNDENHELWNELRRVRDTLHELRPLSTIVDGHTLLLSEVAKRLTGVEETLDTMTQADKFQAALTQATRQQRKEWWTNGRKLAGTAAGVILLAPALHDLVLWLTG